MVGLRRVLRLRPESESHGAWGGGVRGFKGMFRGRVKVEKPYDWDGGALGIHLNIIRVVRV